MLNHQRNNLGISERILGQAQLFINRLAGPQKFSWLNSHFANQFGEFVFAKRLNVVIHLVVRDATRTEQLVQFTTFRSSRFFVDGDFSCHGLLVFWSLVLVFGS